MRQAILIVLNCAVYGSAVEKTVGLLEKEMKLAYPSFSYSRCYSDPFIINQLREKGIFVKSVTEAMHQLSISGVDKVIVLPLHVFQDYDYSLVKKQVKKYKSFFEQMVLLKPLLACKNDYDAFVCAIGQHISNSNDINLYLAERETRVTAVCKKLTKSFHKNQYIDFFVKAVPDSLQLKDIVKYARKSQKDTVRVFQLKFVPEVRPDFEFNTCYYATERMENRGIATECVLQGLGEFSEVRRLYFLKVAKYL